MSNSGSSSSRKPGSGGRGPKQSRGGSRPGTSGPRGGGKRRPSGSQARRRDRDGRDERSERDSRESRQSGKERRGSDSSRAGSSKGRGSHGSGAKDARSRAAGSGSRRPGGPPRRYKGADQRSDEEPIPGDRSWGGLARKGALRATQDERRENELKRGSEREAVGPAEPGEAERQLERERRRAERDERQRRLRAEAKAAVERVEAGTTRGSRRSAKPKRPLDRRPLPKGPARAGDEVEALHRLLGPKEAKKQLRRLRAASEAFEAERYPEARRTLSELSRLVPTVPEVRELYGLALYRLGRFRDAARELEEFRVLAASTEQNPVLMDCYRAQQRWADVEELWNELAEVSPSGPVVNEGRIVWASALADQGDVDGAVRSLAKGWKRPSRPLEHHLRRAYALADLYERSGDLPRARALFEWLVAKDPDFVDARTRLRALR